MTNTPTFVEELNARIAKYDLLCHPYYKAWSMGQLTRDDIAAYASDYYSHVAAFPEYLDKLQSRLPEGEVKALVLENKRDEEAPEATSHAELWLDFAEGMGSQRSQAQKQEPIAEIKQLIESFNDIAANGSTHEALAAFYAYESQVPRVAAEKERGLKDMYGADDKTAYYFTLHKAYDIVHSQTWLKLLTQEVGDDSEKQAAALVTAEKSAKALWKALDGIERRRLAAVS
jgi:pyrroloquinoline-quinone synthase